MSGHLCKKTQELQHQSQKSWQILQRHSMYLVIYVKAAELQNLEFLNIKTST